jgi:phenylalanyl-tRNA synthetase alpha chain
MESLAHVPTTRVPLSAEQLSRDLAIRDLSDPADGPHAIQLVANTAVSALEAAWRRADASCAVRWCRGPRIVPIADNYDQLGYDPADVTRAVRYTRYVDGNRMLRSHSTAIVPPALRQLAADRHPPADVLLACPGIAYRRDAIDWQHTGTPQQLDLWRISKRALADLDLDEMIAVLLDALVPGLPSRHEPRVHPYTTGGRQVDVRHDGVWVEIAECGLAHPDVLARAGLRGYTGLALGMGLDRMLMLHKQIPDIRLLRSADPRTASQMLDLLPYRLVSSQPPIRRDLSIAVDADEDDETLGDQVREALGPGAEAVEDVTILSSTRCADLPPAALARLGARPEQRNLLVRVVIRQLDRTLTDDQANHLRDRIYARLHKGTAWQWASDQASRSSGLRSSIRPGPTRKMPNTTTSTSACTRAET